MYETILFDIDGVMLSEERYFDASALTVHELLCSPQYLGVADACLPSFRPDPPEPAIRQIRRVVFADDAVLHAMKARGVNANWDMVYLQTAYQITRLLRRWVALCGQAAVAAEVAAITRDGWTREALRRLGEALAATGVVEGARAGAS
ncbi:MAG: HAD family hydrolase, partial [Alicyclobacillaceae bacterium]|nr:HAD family hydrolase [Alicyclobacillaceae bacterium]